MPSKPALPSHLCLLLVLGLMPVVMISAPKPAFAQEGPWSLQGGFGLTAASFTDRATEAEGSLGLRLALAPRLYRVLAARLEGGLDYLGPMCLDVENTCAAPHAAQPRSSETFMLSGAVALGMLTPPLYLGTGSEGVEVALGVFAGREWVEAGLGHGDCLTCRVSGIDLRGGLFLEPTLELWFFSNAALGASYRLYSTASDLHRRLTVRFIARG